MNRPLRTDTLPWYREPWPWLLMLGPAIVVAAGLYTAYLAIVSDDGLVADDYYKQGLEVKKRMVRDQRAATLGIEAKLVIGENRDRLRIFLSGHSGSTLPKSLVLQLTHPTKKGLDQRVVLLAEGSGVYNGQLKPFTGRRHLALEDDKQEWRLLADWNPDEQPELHLLTRTGNSLATGGVSIDRER
ncbi:MAG TPA: FixH family protein [Accumulibacter sp.]|jgi:hypothetical protein|nr:FixH family protein [Accumulibacter sp.]HPP46071.1 FixH family protein [Accumulibacter sp.]